MTESVITNPSLARDFFLGRQPILNREQNLWAYELLFRSAKTGPVTIVDDLSATASVIAHANELGMDHVIGDRQGFINVDAAVLMSDCVEILPPAKVVLEILETVRASPELLQRIMHLQTLGYRFALDDVIQDSSDVQQFLPLVDIVKIDIMNMPNPQIESLSIRFRLMKKKILAEKVETQAEFNQCLAFGFDYFQGYYFSKPVVLIGKKVAPSELAVLQLMGLINSEADNAAIERSIKQDASLSLNLLRLVNTPAAGAKSRIDNLGQALSILGRRQLQRWLQILLYAKTGESACMQSPLLQMATTRGKLLELIAQKLQPGNRNAADMAFMVGIMSLMDVLFHMPMTEVLTKVAVAQDVSEALLARKGWYGTMLKLAEYNEHLDLALGLLKPSLAQLNLSAEDWYQLQIEAFDWVAQIG
jgi:EAL and modified HD-GYP domain-containing signal transduction protein